MFFPLLAMLRPRDMETSEVILTKLKAVILD